MRWWQRLEIALLLWLNRFFSPPRFVMHTEEAVRRPRSELAQEDFARGKEVAASLGKWTPLTDRVVLDLGCGSGVKAMGCAASVPDARLILGVDVDAKALENIREISRERGVKHVAFVVADAAALPLKDQSVDIVFSVNAFEHIPYPHAALAEAARVLKEGGWLWMEFFPLFYSRYGSHLWDYLCVPWAHVLASPQAVVGAYRRVVQAEAPRFLREFAGQYDEEDVREFLAFQLQQFTTLNRLTPGGFYRAVAETGGWHILDLSFHQTSRLERLLALCPGLDRFAVWGIACVLRRDRGAVLNTKTFLRFRWRQVVFGRLERLRRLTRPMS